MLEVPKKLASLVKEILDPEKHFKHIYRGRGRGGSMKKKSKNKNIEPEPKIQYSYKKSV